MALVLSCWYNVSLGIDVITERERYYKNLYDASCVLDTGIILVKQNFDLFFIEEKKTEKISLDMSSLFKNILKNKKIVFTIEQPDNNDKKTSKKREQALSRNQALMLSVQLYDNLINEKNQACLCAVHCVLVRKLGNTQHHNNKKKLENKNEHGQEKIEEKIEERETKREEKDDQYMVQHFTIGALL